MQLRTSQAIEFFDKEFREKFKFEEYEDINKPCLVFGVYRHNDIKAIQNHKSLKIIWFTGSDTINKENLKMIKRCCIDDKTIIIAESNWIKNDLNKFNIKYKYISMLNGSINKWQSKPLGKSLYWYNYKRSRYGKKIFKEIQSAIPDLDIIGINQGELSHSEMKSIYEKCFACLRPVEHDGVSQTVVEMGLMGRISIWNGNIPCSVSYKSTEDIIKKIKELRKGYNYKKVAIETKEFFEENEKKFLELIKKVCGKKEVKKMINK